MHRNGFVGIRGFRGLAVLYLPSLPVTYVTYIDLLSPTDILRRKICLYLFVNMFI